jgi:ribose transport system permease protein
MSPSLPDANPSAQHLAPRPAFRRILEAIGVQNVSLLIALALLVAFIGGQNSNFFYSSNIATIGTTVAIVGILSVVQTVVMLLGGLDISVSSQAGLTSVVSAMVFMATQSAFAGIVTALALGLCTGLLNGVIIIYGRVNAVIATLATLAAYRGLANLISNGRAQGYTGVDHVFIFLARGTIVGIPVLIWILVVVALLAQLALHYTDFGRNIYAVGGNATAARLAGIPLNRYILAIYMLCGLVSALAGVLLTARTGSGQPTSGSQGLELQSITAAALGGCSMQGGKGTIVGTIFAVVLLGVLQNGLIILDVNSFWQDIAQGALLVIAVVIQQRRAGGRGIGLPT